MTQDLTTFPIAQDEIREAINVALRGDYLDTNRLMATLANILIGDGGLPAAITAAGSVALNLDSQIDMLKQAEERIAGRRAALQGIRDTATDWALRVMQDADVKTIHQPGQASIARHKNPPKVEILNEAEIPQLYRKMELVETLDKRAIAEALKNNSEVPGARLVQTERLEIR